MRLALAVTALLLVAAPLHAQKTAARKAKQDTALVAKQQGANKSSKKASTKSASTKSDDSKKAAAKTASKANTKASTKAASTKTDDSRKKSTKAAAKPDAPKASVKQEAAKHETALGGGQFVGSKQGHTYYLASCKAAKALNAANRVEFGSEANAKKAGYTHSKQKGC